MSCSKCCGFKPFFGKVDYAIRDYDPKEDFTNYMVPTWWINRKRKVAWFLVSKEGGKSFWIPFQFGAFIQKILTDCGEILPENGQIQFKQGKGIVFSCDGSKLTFDLEIPILAEYGGTGFTEYKLGDLLVGNLDGELSKLAIGEKGKALGVTDDGTLGYIDIVQKLNCSEDPVTENALTRWNIDGKCLKNGIATEDDNGNVFQKNSLPNDTLKHTINNLSTEPNSHSKLELRTQGENAGNPSVHWSVDGKMDYSAGIDNADDDSWKICPNFILNNSAYLRIDRTGNVTKPLQIRCLALFPRTVNNLLGDKNEYFFGTSQSMKEVKDIGNQFYPGDGSFGRADYTSNKNGSYYIEIVVNFFNSEASQSSATEFLCRVRVNGTARTYENRASTPSQLSRDGILTSFIIDTDIGDKITFSIQGDQIGNRRSISIFGSDLPLITTAIGVYCLG